MISKCTKGRMKNIEKMLEEDEKIIEAVSGVVNGTLFGEKTDNLDGVLVLTPERVLFHYKRKSGFYRSKIYPLKEISSINFEKGILGSNIQMQNSISSLKVTLIPTNENAEDFVRKTRSYITEIANNNVCQVTCSHDVIEQIKKFSRLNKQGVITDNEFSAKKKQLLGI
ncbi:PH domain-containing protein [uncultured Methanolobus sp.]|uniref:PH domain-containing protein n=1 Tax=uncultured Methanolobus sp. TaxID=218300 RepID=UPI002AAAF582|nr:PH domain-containing protein [uncultured Methanolobus sp.]